MYWVVLACALLIESWTDWFLAWYLSPFLSSPTSSHQLKRYPRIPFYAYLRLLFLLYLVLPQTQGARIIYQTHLQPWLHDNEQQIEDFIASAHHRLKQAGISYIKRAIELLRTNVLGLPPSPPSATAADTTGTETGSGQTYTQALLARFSLPSARWTGKDSLGGSGAADFYNLLASAVGAATATGSSGADATTELGSGPEYGPGGLAASGMLVPDNIQGASAKMSFIAAQRERLAFLMSALEREESQLQTEATADRERAGSLGLDGVGGAPLSKSRSEPDFEKLEAESGEEEDAGLRKRTPASGGQAAGWVSWAWGGGGGGAAATEGKSTAVEKE
jgi:hypothetical protein